MKISLKIRGLNREHLVAKAFNWMLEQYFNGLLDSVNTFIGQFALPFGHDFHLSTPVAQQPRLAHRR
jgi:hypothetical protein